jgi:aldose 1-epimerase
LGFPALQGYINDVCYLGATIGRYANRIANGRFRLDEIDYQLETNDGPHSNHSGSSGFHSKVFDHEIIENGVSFNILSEHGDGGFPGNLRFVVDFSWVNMELNIDYKAVTDQNTIVNFSNHTYFNLTAGKLKIFEHELTIHANKYLEANIDHIPTGAILKEEAMMFNKKRIGSRLQVGENKFKGLNICYVIDLSASSSSLVAELYDPVSGRLLQVFSTYPGLLLYTGDYLRSNLPGHYAAAYKPFDGLCLECQYFPNSPNHPNFPSSVLEAGKLYQESISFKFNVVL